MTFDGKLSTLDCSDVGLSLHNLIHVSSASVLSLFFDRAAFLKSLSSFAQAAFSPF